MSPAGKKYFVCEQQAFVVIFVKQKFWLYLLLSQPFTILTDQQELKAAFALKHFHERSAGCLDFLAEYDFELHYFSSTSNRAKDLLSRINH